MQISRRSTLPENFAFRSGFEAMEPVSIQVNERLQLRQLQRQHADELFEVVDANRHYLREWLSWVDGTRTSAESLAFIESTLCQVEENAGFQTAIFQDEQIVGVIGHHRIDRANRSTTIGYWLAESARGAGVMTAACQAFVGHAFEILQLNRVQICCATDNYRSRAIPERLGFAYEGVRREAEWLNNRFVNHAIYSRLAGDSGRS